MTLPRAVFFDVGDTLLDTSAMLDSALYTALVPIDPARTIADVRQAVRASAPEMPTRQPPFWEVRGNVDWWEARYRAIGVALGLRGPALERFLQTVTKGHFDGDPLHVVADAPAALARLAERGIDLGVISNWDHTLEAILKRKGLARFFKVIVASTTLGHAKPERAIFAHALERIGARADEAWHVGDDANADAIGAARAGLHALLLDPHGLYASLEADGIARAATLTQAASRILEDGQGAASGSGAPST